MALFVYKFGGTSVGTTERIKAVANKVKKAHDQGDQIVVVVSAMSGETNRLIALAKEMQKQPTERELDVLVSTGEQVTVALLCMALHDIDCPAFSFTGSQVKILTDNVLLAISMNASMPSVQEIHDHVAKYVTILDIWRSKNYGFDFVECINIVVHEAIINEICESEFHTPIVNESTDISVTKMLIVYIKYRPPTKVPQNSFCWNR